MTEEEADALDEYFTKNPPKANTAKKGGFFTDQRKLLDALEKSSADYIMAQAESANKLPVQVINELIRERIARIPQEPALCVAEPAGGVRGVIV
jgi:DNA recombination-dependent growth factor C